MGKETVNKRRAKLKPVMSRMNIVVRQCWRDIYLGVRHVLGEHNSIVAAEEKNWSEKRERQGGGEGQRGEEIKQFKVVFP